MYVLINVLIIIAAILLILVVLVQKSKGGGLAAGFDSANNMFGVRRATDAIEKATWILAGVIIVLSILAVGISIANKGHVQDGQTSAISEQVNEAAAQQQQQTATPAFGETAEETAE